MVVGSGLDLALRRQVPAQLRPGHARRLAGGVRSAVSGGARPPTAVADQEPAGAPERIEGPSTIWLL